MYILYKIAEFIALTFPIRISYWIADVSASIYYLLAKRDRETVNSNLKVIFKHINKAQDISGTSRMVFVNFARYLVEFFRISKINLKYIEKHIEIEGRENLDSAFNLQKGVIIVSAHLGNWELAASALAMLGYKINVVAWTHTNKLINDFFLKRRKNKGVKVIALGTSIRKIFSVLQNNRLVALLGDIDYVNPRAGITVKFFGQDTVIPKGPAALSLKTGAPIVPAFILREEGNNFRFIFERPILPRSSQNRKSDLVNLTQSITQTIESYIARDPAQWFMLRPRWQSHNLMLH